MYVSRQRMYSASDASSSYISVQPQNHVYMMKLLKIKVIQRFVEEPHLSKNHFSFGDLHIIGSKIGSELYTTPTSAAVYGLHLF